MHPLTAKLTLFQVLDIATSQGDTDTVNLGFNGFLNTRFSLKRERGSSEECIFSTACHCIIHLLTLGAT